MRNVLLLILLVLSVSTFGQEAELITQQKDLGTITLIDYSSDGKLIVSGSAKDHLVKVWDVKSGKVLGVLTGHEETTTLVKFVGNNEYVLSSDTKGHSYLWDLNSWSLKDSLNHKTPLISIDCSDGSSKIFLGDKNGGVFSSDVNDFQIGKKIGQIKGRVTQLKYHKTKNVLFAGSKSGQVKAWSLADGKKRKVGKLFSSAIVAMEFYDNNSKLLLASIRGKLVRVDLETFKKMDQFSLNSGSITALTLNKNMVAYTGINHKITFYDLLKKERIHQ